MTQQPTDLSGAVDLAAIADRPKTAKMSGAGMVVLRHLDQDGTYQVDMAYPDEKNPMQGHPVVPRTAYLTFEDMLNELVHAVRTVVRQELARLGFDEPVGENIAAFESQERPGGPPIVTHIPEQRVRSVRIKDTEEELVEQGLVKE